MKITHIWSVLCGQSIINSDNNQISLLNVMERFEINAVVQNSKDFEKDINIAVAYEVVSFWINSSEDKEVKGIVDISVKNPNNEERHLFSTEFTIPANTKRLRTRLKIAGFVVKGSGIYNFIIKFRETEKDEPKEVTILPLEVVVNKVIQPDSSKKVN